MQEAMLVFWTGSEVYISNQLVHTSKVQTRERSNSGSTRMSSVNLLVDPKSSGLFSGEGQIRGLLDDAGYLLDIYNREIPMLIIYFTASLDSAVYVI